MKYSDFEVQKVREADIRLFVRGADEVKSKTEMDCPFCHAKKKFTVLHKGKYNYAKCWVCGEGFSGPLEAYAYLQGLDIKRDYVKCIEGVANMAGITITPEEQVREKKVKEEKKKVQKTFTHRQLEDSGLTVDDVMATVKEKGQDMIFCPFQPGSIKQGLPYREGDDMLIYYYDLYGNPVQYTAKGARTMRNYVRVRYENPDIHTGADGDPMKYQSPAGSSSPAYVPEVMRRLFKNKSQVDTLFLQEGEKKAEKACKHGMYSLGLQGISNIGNKENGLIQAIQDFAKRCQVRNIVLVMDADWDDLSRNLRVGERADMRPNTFAHAVIKFKQYIQTFHNLGMNIDVWWAHVNKNENGDKGVDDLLVGSLKGREDELMKDIDFTMHTHDGKGKWLDVHKITTLSDAKIKDFWSLNDWQNFFEIHKARLVELPSFRLGSIRYKVEDDKLVRNGSYSSDLDIFTIEKDSKDNDKVQLSYTETFRFLAASGFYRIANSDEGGSGFGYIHIDDGIIDSSAPYEMRDFILDYIMTNCKNPLVHEYFNSKLDVLLPDKKLERLEMKKDEFNNFEPDVQRSYYNNGMVEITSQSITPEQPIANVWRSRIVPRKFKRVKVIDFIDTTGDYFMIKFTDEGLKCDFVQYLVNVSNNYFSHDAPREVTDDERFEWYQNIVNKITAIGYLLTDWKYPSDRKAVVIQDHKISEVGQAWGGAGKSILGTALSHVVNQAGFDGKTFNPSDDFALDGVTKATRNIFIDDIRTNFNFQLIFNWVTGDLPVNPKGKTRFVIKAEDSPKILISTNHAIKDADQGSVKRRIAYMEFSSWYNQDHTVVDDFGHQFFFDWDELQWTLFDNFMAECVMYYLRSFENAWNKKGEGVVPPPMKNIELRTLRQSMSETLLQWAEDYYDPTSDHLNSRINRKDLFDSFLEYAGGLQGHGVTRSNFKNKIKDF
ncbi:MAG: transcription elongation factor 1 family protein, partial [Muribaculaceae bacterium]|nr:transcription elongation factor 1 family protein [Muribaculaceae bacterium]